jgi:casein kinase 1
MTTYINYTRNLGFEEDPNYDYLRGLFRKIMESHLQQFDFIFDWTKPDDYKAITSNVNKIVI